MEIIRNAMTTSDSISFGAPKDDLNEDFYVVYSPISGSSGILKFLYNRDGKWLLDFVSLSEGDLTTGLDMEVFQHHIHLSDSKISVSGHNLKKLDNDPICKSKCSPKSGHKIDNEKVYCDIGK